MTVRERFRAFRDAVVRVGLGVDLKSISASQQNIRSRQKSIQEQQVSIQASHVAIEKQLKDLARQLGDISSGIRNIRSVEEERTVHADQLASGVSAIFDNLDSVRGLVVSSRDEIPRLRRKLREIRSDAAYPVPFTSREPLVSVRIASFEDTESLMDRALASVLRQTYSHFEVVVVNDGPNERTRRAIDSLKDTRIRYTEFPFRRVYPTSAEARWMVAGSPGMNEAAWEARGDWIAPLDDDDEFTDSHIATLLELARKERAELVYGALDRVDEGEGKREQIFAYPPLRGGFSFQGALYHSGLRFFEYDEESWRAGEPGDWNLVRRMMAAGVRIAATSEVVGTLYRLPFADKTDRPEATPGEGEL